MNTRLVSKPARAGKPARASSPSLSRPKPYMGGHYRHRPGSAGYDDERVQVLSARLLKARQALIFASAHARTNPWYPGLLLGDIAKIERDLTAVRMRQVIRDSLDDDDRKSWNRLSIVVQNRVASGGRLTLRAALCGETGASPGSHRNRVSVGTRVTVANKASCW